MGVSSWFSDFCSNLQIRDGGTISSRYKAITRRLNTDFWNTTRIYHIVFMLGLTEEIPR